MESEKGYKKLLVSSGSKSGIDKTPTVDEYENAMKGKTDLNNKIVKLGELNELSYEDLILSIYTSSSLDKVAFDLVRNAKSTDFPESDCKIGWERLVSKYALHTASSLLKLKRKFHNSKLKSIKKDPDKWVSNLEWLQL